MSLKRVAAIFDNVARPETTGVYCRRALGHLVEIEHFLPSEMARIPKSGFDLYLYIDDGLHYPIPRDLRPNAWWAIDTHLDFERALQTAQNFDHVFAAQRDGAEDLRRQGIASATWLPLACDPHIHCQHDLAKRFDVCFVGNVFPGSRADLLAQVQESFPNSFVGQRYFDDMARAYSESRIVFNRSLRNDINMRVFEALACGSLLVTNDLRENGQEELFRDGVHLATYHDAQELLDKIAFYLRHDDLRERIAAAGRVAVLADHTYEHRMRTVLETVERLPTRRACAAGVKPAVKSGVSDVGCVERFRADTPAVEVAYANRRSHGHGDRHPGVRSAVPVKDTSYFEFLRPEVLALVPESARHVLDVGCGAGKLGESIKQRQPAEVVGIELNVQAAEKARTRLDEVCIANVEDDEVHFPDLRFDCIVCADVLEHLREPAPVLAKLRRWLAHDGVLVASLPNVRHHSVVSSLLEGNWTYESAGLLDNDHVRFFTRREIEKLLYRQGFEILTLQAKPGPGHAEWEQAGRPGAVQIGSLQISGMDPAEAEEFFTYQYLLVARPVLPPVATGAALLLPPLGRGAIVFGSIFAGRAF